MGSWAVCPFHAAVAQMTELRNRFGCGGILPPSLPLFPDVTGAHVSKVKVVELLRHMSLKANPSVDVASISGHSFRVTGARMLASRGIDIELIMLLARWRSSVVYRYAQDTPLATITARYREGLVSADEPQKANTHVTAEELDAVKSQLAELRNSGTALRSAQSPGFVLNVPSGIVHSLKNATLDTTSSYWRSRCGWRFSSGHFRLLFDPLDHKKCAKCFEGSPRSSSSSC
eukprot:6454838-Amphidinium_carterae.1